MSEFRRFLRAVEFLTVVPVPKVAQLEPDWLTRSGKYFPLVGILVGVLSAAVLLLASRIWPGPLPALLAVIAGIAITGALHEDGLADTADGFGGGRTPAARLAIMKDSRLGTYGALALGLSLALRIAALSALPPQLAAAALIATHGAGRLGAVALMAVLPYAGDRNAAKVSYGSDRLDPLEIVLATAFGVLAVTPALLLAPSAALTGVFIGAAAVALLAYTAGKLIGGYTGDVLGAAEQLSGTASLVAISAISASA